MRWVPIAVLLFMGAAAAQGVSYSPVSKEVLEKRLHEVRKDNAEREATLKRFFGDAGCIPPATELPVKHQDVPNIVCTLKGSSDSLIVVGAHSDHVHSGEGAADNWSGAALLPSLFEGLSHASRKHTFVFVGFTAEEKGLLGSKAYADQMSKEDRAKTRAMVDIDTLGLSPTKVWATRADKKLLEELIRVAYSMKLPLEPVNADRVGMADSFSFDKYKIPTIAIHSVTQETFRILHTDKDTLAVVNMDDYYDSYRLLAVYLAHLDNVLP